MKELSFIGEGRNRVVTGLFELYKRIQISDKPVFVTIEAPSGWGKTRIVKELYKRIASTQTSLYWPAEIDSQKSQESTTIEDKRKQIIPSTINRAKNSVPDFLWFAIDCDGQNLPLPEILRDCSSQFESHKLFVEHRSQQLKKLNYKNLQISEKLSIIGSDLTEDLIGGGIGELADLLGAAFPFGGTLLKQLKNGTSAFKQNRQNQSVINAFGSSPADHQNICNLLEKLEANCSHGIPVIFVIEDFHNRSATLDEFLNELHSRNISALVIGTGFEENYQQDESQSYNWQSECIRISQHLLLPSVIGSEDTDLKLTKSEISGLIKQSFPQTQSHIIQKLAESFDSPLTLALNLEGCSDAEEITEDDFEAFSDDTKDFYKAKWKALPNDLRKYLAVAALATNKENLIWNNEIVEALIAKEGQNTAILSSDGISSDWLLFKNKLYLQFKNLERYITAEASKDRLLRSKLTKYQNMLFDELAASQTGKLDLESIENESHTLSVMLQLAHDMEDYEKIEHLHVCLISFFQQTYQFVLHQTPNPEYFYYLKWIGSYLVQLEEITEFTSLWRDVEQYPELAGQLMNNANNYYGAHEAADTYSEHHFTHELTYLMESGSTLHGALYAQIASRAVFNCLRFSDSSTFETTFKYLYTSALVIETSNVEFTTKVFDENFDEISANDYPEDMQHVTISSAMHLFCDMLFSKTSLYQNADFQISKLHSLISELEDELNLDESERYLK